MAINEQEIGETIIRMIGEDANFVFICHKGDRTTVVSDLPPKAITVVLKEQIRRIEDGTISELSQHETSEPS